MSGGPAAFRDAQLASWAGHHDEAERLWQRAAAEASQLTGLHLQGALIAARRGDLATAAQRLDDPTVRPAVRELFTAWLDTREGRAEEAIARLEPLLAGEDHNRVIATALADAYAQAGRTGDAVKTLQAGPGDNFELLSWAWLGLERAALALPVPDEPPVPQPEPLKVSRGTAARWLRAGDAAWMGNTNFALRKEWLARARDDSPPLWLRLLRPLLEACERRWPTDPLAAFLCVKASGHDFEDLPLNVGVVLCEEGYYRAALTELDLACARMDGQPEFYLPVLYRAAALVELRRWDEAAAALEAVARADLEEDEARAGDTYEFGQPHWFMFRGRIRLARGDEAGAQADLLRALDGEPATFDERLTRLARLFGNEAT